MEPSQVILCFFVGACVGIVGTLWAANPNWKPVDKIKELKADPMQALRNEVVSVHNAISACVREIDQIKKEHGGRISRVDNKDIFDRLDNLEKAIQAVGKEPSFTRHEHYHMSLPKGKEKNSPLGKGVTALFPETEV
jgi:hypothetical protein